MTYPDSGSDWDDHYSRGRPGDDDYIPTTADLIAAREPKKMERKLARISDTFLGDEDHGIFTFWLQLDYEGGHGSQSAGSYDLRGPCGSLLLREVIRTVGAAKWESLKGGFVYALVEDGLVRGIEQMTFDSEPKRLIFKEFIDNYNSTETRPPKGK